MIQNEYIFVAPGVARIKVTGLRRKTKPDSLDIDGDDIGRLKPHTWTVTRLGYGSCTKCGLLLHRLLLDAPSGTMVDHVDRNPRNNRKNNLRFCKHRDNMRNVARKGTLGLPVAGIRLLTSGRWNVVWETTDGWEKLGNFDNVYDAVLCRIRTEYLRMGRFHPSYRSLLKTVPRRYLESWLPEIYGKDNIHYVESEIWYAHYINRDHWHHSRRVMHAHGVRKIPW